MSDASRLTNGETFFFRDHGQFDLLRLRLLPELIERRRDTKTLRLWSAGCSSGEEAYSLAMLLDTLLPQRDGWRILILGSDINEASLVKARQARYGQWSFRMVPATLRQRYFQQQNDEWVLEARIRDMVTFRPSNLIEEVIPGTEMRDMDLILCRNVFIYFTAAIVAAVAEKLAAALCDGGYLMTAHTELGGHSVHKLQSRLFAESVVYQRIAPLPANAIPRPAAIAPRSARSKPVPPAPSTPPATAPDTAHMLAAAQRFADRGDYDQAERACQQVLAVAPLAPEPHFLLAQLAQLKGDFEHARELLDKAIYLDPHGVAPHLELAALCERTGKLHRAQTLRRAALGIVRALPGDTLIQPYETTAGEMLRWLTELEVQT